MKSQIDPALHAFLLDNPQALLEIHDPQTMRASVKILLDAGFSYANVIVRIRQACAFPQDAFEALLAYVGGNPQRQTEFAAAVGAYGVGQWSELNIELPPNLFEYFSGSAGGIWLYERHHNGMITPEHPFYAVSGRVVDEFWAYQVRRFCATGDFKRSWDELCRARRGIVAKGTDKRLILNDEAPRMFKADVFLLGELALQLFNAMVEKGVLKPLAEEDFVVPSSTIAGRVYETVLASNGRRPENRSWSYSRPGYRFARDYPHWTYDEEKGEVGKDESRFQKAGASILKMAAHFADRDNDNKLRRHQEALAKFDAKHPLRRPTA